MTNQANRRNMMGSFEDLQASQDFNKARNRALLSRIQNFMNTEKDSLLSFYDVKKILKPGNEVYKGMETVPIKLIVGSEGRYRDFNKYFLPRSEFLRSRWERVDKAQIRDIPLPAIQLYEIGGAYFVRDGNHRVSVARAQGVEEIDAEVTSLTTEIAITPSMTAEEIKEAVINYEKKLFYEKTRFGELTGDDNLVFTQPGRYDEIYNHIMVHKYYLNQDRNEEIPFAEALVSWYKNVYSPIMRIINDDMLCLNFPGRRPSDLSVWIVSHWDFLKKKNGLSFSISAAARDFTVRYGKKKRKFFRFIVFCLEKIFKR
jgi:hypothetical protein